MRTSYRSLLLILPLLLPGAAGADDVAVPFLYAGEGKLGTAPIVMALEVQGDRLTARSHYADQAHLADIPLTGIAGPDFVLREADGGVFRLRFKGDGSEHGATLGYDNSVGVIGSWSRGGRTLPVAIALSRRPGGMPSRWYANVWDIDDQSDAVFEARIRAFYRAVMAGERAAAARMACYPLRVNFSATRRLEIGTPRAFEARWRRIFTPSWLRAAARTVPHELSIVESQAMLGNGLAFFDGRGLIVVNVLKQ